ncbi:myb-like protein P isoform X2 [Teleopsis dalmanni]|uniref:myb-like protein P isoform X2 n=1 Tax=Teleopsis dalmanni TaxID=139649 RepID=UPI0018CF8DF6|nr:myb-like protein P isoform X2 [Teleopsis dalmanni]
MRDTDGALLVEINPAVNCAHLPARATRLLNRSRLQQQCPISNADSDSSKSAHSVRRSVAASRASSASTASNASLHRNTHLHQRDSHSSSDDLMLYDKSFRNAMIQEVLQFKKQLLRLRRILQEDEDGLTRTETLNPFETDNGQLFASCGLDSKLLDDIDLASLTSSTTDDPLQELADLRRQGQVDDRDRTIRLQRNLIEKLEAEKAAGPNAKTDITKECINTATQTERTRPLAIGTENLSRSKPEYHSYTTHFPAICNDSTTVIQHQQQYPGNSNALNQTRRHTIISTTLTNYNHQQMGCQAPRRASIAWEQQQPEEQSAQTPNLIPKTYKPVRITLIGEPLKQWNGLNSSLNGEGKYMKNINGSHAELENKKNLLNGSKEFVNGNSTNNINSSKCNSNNNKISIDSPFNGTSSCKQNGYHNSSAVIAGNGLKQTTLQMENIVNNTQQHYHHHQQQQQQLQQQKQQQINGNLYPTVTIV